MTPTSPTQQNAYKGSPPRSWIHVRFTALDGTTRKAELLADTGNPFAVILGDALLGQLKWFDETDTTTNFGVLAGGWLRLIMPELGLDQLIVGYGSDAVVAAAQRSSPDFEGLVGLPFLRLLEYGGDANALWIRPACAIS